MKKMLLILILIIGLFTYNACSVEHDQDQVADDVVWDTEEEINIEDADLTMDDFSEDGIYVIHPDGTAEAASNGDFCEHRYYGSTYCGTPMEVSKSKDSIACIDSNGNGESVQLLIAGNSLGYTYYTPIIESPDYNTMFLTDSDYILYVTDLIAIDGIDISSCNSDVDKINSMLKSAGIFISIDDTDFGVCIFSDENKSIEIKYHVGTQVNYMYAYVNTEAFGNDTGELEIPMTLMDSGYGIADISDLPNGYYVYRMGYLKDYNCSILHIVD